MRRILIFPFDEMPQLGTTSAHAENTPVRSTTVRVAWNYLRARGEYHLANPPGDPTVELPPRTRRIPGRLPPWCFSTGTTSAHAENTTRRRCALRAARNYLRARGEYLANGHNRGLIGGTTSAHAENTSALLGAVYIEKNYLRARGEYQSVAEN